MKKLYTILAAVLITASGFAQAPEKMSYQAVVRDSDDNLIANQPVGMQISILQTSATGTAVYVETQTPATNVNGLVALEIGAGTVVSGDFTTIDWSADTYFIKTETDPTGGSSYSITGTSQLLSVPFALYAKTSGNVQTYNTDTSGTDFNISTNGDTHTFNLPSASESARGVVSTSNQTMAGDKTFTGTVAASSKLVVGNSTITDGAALEVSSTTATFLPPRMTTVQRDAIASVPEGSMIYNLTDKKAQVAVVTVASDLDQSTWGASTGGGLISSGESLGQTFIATSSATVTQIGFYGTYGTWATGTISCKVYDSVGGNLLATSPDTSTIKENNTHLFTFSGLSLTAGQSYYVDFEIIYSGGYLYSYGGTNYDGGDAYINGVVDPALDLPFKIFHPAYSLDWENLH